MGKGRIEGIIVPFRVRDSYNTWFDEKTDYFLLNGWRSRPVFFYHNFDEDKVGRIGELLDDSFEFRPQGLYGVAQLGDSPLAQEAYELVASGRAAWSGGAMPNPRGTTFRVRKTDGYVERFALAEASVCPAELAASPRGTTTIEHMRTYYPGVELPDGENSMFMRRAPWALSIEAEGSGGGGTPAPVTTSALPAAVAAPPAPQASPDILAELRRQGELLESLVNPATRAPAPAGLPVAPRIGVTSQYDDPKWSLLNMLVYQRLRQSHALRTGAPGPKVDNEFMRAVVDKARKMNEESSRPLPMAKYWDIEKGIIPTPFRAITPAVEKVWHEKVPYFRADEAMQSDLANYGDELLPTMLSEVLYYFYRMDSAVLGAFNSFQMPSNPYDMPKVTSFPTMRLVNEIQHRSQFTIPTDPHPDSKVGTDKVTFTVRGWLGAMTLASRMLSHFANVDVVEMITTALRRELAYMADYVLLNGDETETASNSGHGADPTGTSYDGLLLLNGLREIALTNSDKAATATIASDTPGTIAATMGTRGIMGLDIPNLVMFCDPGSQFKFNALADYETVYAVGAGNATLLTGQVGAVKGVPVVPLQQLELADANGVYESTHLSGTKGQQVLCWRPGIMIGRMGDVFLEIENVRGNWVAVTDIAIDLQVMEAGAVALGYNSTV